MGKLSNHVVQNCQTGEKVMGWDILNKENSNLLALNVPGCHFLPILAILYHVIAQEQKAHLCLVDKVRCTCDVSRISLCCCIGQLHNYVESLCL